MYVCNKGDTKIKCTPHFCNKLSAGTLEAKSCCESKCSKSKTFTKNFVFAIKFHLELLSISIKKILV